MSAARRTALVSLAAAVGLALGKLAVGAASGSLGILAEAVHSGLDAVAALLTLLAVGVSERPPDREHHYGHGKAQHLSALGEAALLAAAAIWIAAAAAGRLRDGGGHVDAAWWAFALVAVVLAVDAGRFTVSLRIGRRGNAALIANAWHFASDFAGTCAVLVGLVLVAAGVQGGDSVAALIVAVLVLVAAGRLARVNVDVLMDRAPSGLRHRVEGAVRGVPGVSEVRSVRVREAGGESFADVVIAVPRLEGLERSHETTAAVERAVASMVGRSQVNVHVEPTAAEERANDRVAAAALRVPGVVETHNITVLEGPAGLAVTLHVRLAERMALAEAAVIVERLKDEIRRELGIARVYAHVEPFAPDAQPARDVSVEEPELQRRAAAVVRPLVGHEVEIVVYRQGGRLLVVTSARVEPGLSVREAHTIASRIEDAVREALTGVDDVIVEIS